MSCTVIWSSWASALCTVTQTLSSTNTPRDLTIREFVGGMTDELGGSHITEYVSNGPKNYAYRTADGKQVVKIKGFTLNYVASKQLTFDVMKEMAVSEEQNTLTIVERPQIRRDLKRRQVNTLPSSKSYQRIFDKRVRDAQNHTSLPFGFA